jgi:hypothetical protein
MPAFETKIYALGVYWHAEVTYCFYPGDHNANVADDIEITDLWLLGCYPEGCESRAVDRNDYESVRIKADLDYFEPAESADLLRRCWINLAGDDDYEI